MSFKNIFAQLKYYSYICCHTTYFITEMKISDKEIKDHETTVKYANSIIESIPENLDIQIQRQILDIVNRNIHTRIKEQTLTYSPEEDAIEDWKEYKESGIEISNLGRVRNKKNKKLRTPSINTDGYLKIIINKFIDNKPKRFLLHRLVAELFCPNDDPKHKDIVSHLDDNKTNCRASNLKWTTQSGNMRDGNSLVRCALNIYRKVGCYNENDELIKQFLCVNEAAEWFAKYASMKLGRDILPDTARSTIYHGLNTGHKVYKLYYFRYIDED